jgi:hypothetical protein
MATPYLARQMSERKFFGRVAERTCLLVLR